MTEVSSGRTLACGELNGLFTVRARFDDPIYVIVMRGDLELAADGAGPVIATSLPTQLASERNASCRDSQRVAIDCWGAPL